MRLLVILIIVVALLAVGAWYKLLREVPQSGLDDVAELYKYGSIGTEDAEGLPYWIWIVLPRVFPEYLPGAGGYAALGFAWEEGKPLPVGFSRKTIGFERVGINCALCHTATLRAAADASPQVFPGGPGTTVDILGYQRFLFACASDPRFNASTLLAAIAPIYELSFIDRLLYRLVLIPQTRRALLKQKEQFAFTDDRPDWGRGRIDPFNPVKVRVLDVGVGDTVGNADMMPIWALRPRQGQALHWDGLNTDTTEVVRSSALGDGATPKSIPLGTLEKLQNWLLDLKPPAYPFGHDAELAAAGAAIYYRDCAECHAPGGAKTGKVEPVAAVGTDPHRAEMWTAEAAKAYNAYAASYAWGFHAFRSTGGYLNVPLDAIWIRAPYLHNGSVPTLADLLEPPVARPATFYRGSDVYDPVEVGFISSGAHAERVGFFFDTAEKGNGNQGHLWGTELPPADKAALLEYLKTL